LEKTNVLLCRFFFNKIPIGLIYTDRAISNEPLTEEDFNAFKYFAQQANIGLAMYRMQRIVNGKKDSGIDQSGSY